MKGKLARIVILNLSILFVAFYSGCYRFSRIDESSLGGKFDLAGERSRKTQYYIME